MQQLITSVLFLSLVFSGFAQDYIPMVREGNKYTFTTNNYDLEFKFNSVYTMKGDSLINGHVYKKVYRKIIPEKGNEGPDSLRCFLREDILLKKVWIKYPYSVLDDTTEILLYDFGVDVGDTITYWFRASQRELFGVKVEVAGVKKVHLMNTFLQFENFEPDSMAYFAGNLIDTILDITKFNTTANSLTGGGHLLSSEYGYEIHGRRCLSVTDGKQEIYEYGDFCEGIIWDGIDERKSDNFISVFPNPSKGKIGIMLSESLVAKKIDVQVYSLSGKLVYNGVLDANEDQFNLDLSHLGNGNYILKILHEGDQLHSENLIIQN